MRIPRAARVPSRAARVPRAAHVDRFAHSALCPGLSCSALSAFQGAECAYPVIRGGAVLGSVPIDLCTRSTLACLGGDVALALSDRFDPQVVQGGVEGGVSFAIVSQRLSDVVRRCRN